ncbi:MAG: ABC transporter ATP-binding protein [Ruminococcaceae bacterium]|nr:ABC transporter ATP-binding protein [Oscillospiraceae bacterium]
MENKKYGLKWILQKTKKCRLQMIIYALLALCIPIIQLLFAYFMKLFIDVAVGSSNRSLLDIALYSIAAIIAGGAVMMINSVLAKNIYGTNENNLRTELMNIILSRRMIDISKQHSGELLTRLTADIQAISSCYITIAENIIGGLASALFAVTALFFHNWKIAVILIILTPLMMSFMGALTPQIQKVSDVDKNYDEINRSIMQENLNKIVLIKTYSMQTKITEKMKSAYKNKLKIGMILGAWEGIAMFVGTLSGNVMSLVTLGLGSYFVLNGETTVGSLIMIVQLLNYIITPLTKFPAAVTQIGQAAASSERIGEIYELPSEQVNNAISSVNAKKLCEENLSFAYTQEENILNNIDLSFSKSAITGIIGKSGSGKSTLLKLLMGLYEPSNGLVTLEHDLGTLSGSDIITQVAYVPPSDYLFSGTVAENIIMSEENAIQNQIHDAALKANILDFINSMPNGFDTMLGEDGNTVSSGQAQRIAIARAIYKKSKIFIFDEPTANLDEDSIMKFQTTVKKLAEDNICIIVTHDTSTIEICDKVYILSDGTVTEKIQSTTNKQKA